MNSVVRRKSSFRRPPDHQSSRTPQVLRALTITPPSESEFVGPSAGVRQVYERRSVKVHIGPLPDPETLKELAALYPEAPKVIFEDFHAQCSHRIQMEELRMKTTSTLALRGQMIGGILGAIGLVGSLIVAGIGHGWAGWGKAGVIG